MDIYIKRYDDKMIKIFDSSKERKKEIVITTVKDFQKEAEVELYVEQKKIGSLIFKNLPPSKARELSIPVRIELVNRDTVILRYKNVNGKIEKEIFKLPDEEPAELNELKTVKIDKKVISKILFFVLFPILTIFLIILFGNIIYKNLSNLTFSKPDITIINREETKVENKSDNNLIEPKKIEYTKDKLQGVINDNTPIHFVIDSTELLPDEYKKIENILKYLKNYTDIELKIDGHTEAIGKEANEMKLSIDRAESIKNIFEKFAKENSIMIKITTNGYGSKMQAMPNAPDNLKFKNRRVEIELLEAKGKE